MEKKYLKVLAFAMALMPFSSARVNANPVPVILQVMYDDPLIEHGNPHKSPVLIPSLSIDGHELIFVTPCDGFELSVVDANGQEVYSTTVPVNSNTLELPANISGEYQLRLSFGGDYYFYGYITL